VGKTALVVIGGWSGSVYFSSSITSSAKRSKFAQSLAAFMNQYSFDGIDIDWEYGERTLIVCRRL
jgi:chitinase